MSDPDSPTNPTDLEPGAALSVAERGPDDAAAGSDGQWVWQFAAPAPPPSFGAQFFAGHAHKEHYRFFGCALLVVIGCLLPWGPVGEPAPPAAESGAAAPLVVAPPDVLGVETPAGAISLMIGLWLLVTSCRGIYTGRPRILPVFLMIEPAIVTWLRTLDAWGRLEGEGTLDRLQDLFVLGGTGVMLTLLGSTWVAGGFLLLLGKVYTKKDDKGAARRSGGRTKKEGESAVRAGSRIDKPAAEPTAASGAPAMVAAPPATDAPGSAGVAVSDDFGDLLELETDGPTGVPAATEAGDQDGQPDEPGAEDRNRRGGRSRRGRRR